MFNRSGEGYAGPVSQNLITHQTASSLRSHDESGKVFKIKITFIYIQKKIYSIIEVILYKLIAVVSRRG
jgi:hypothetical protein